MATKATWLFNGRSERTGNVWGFSETWYTNLAGDALVTAMDLVSSRRVQILSSDTQVVGYRIGTANGRAYVVRKEFKPPMSNDHSNLPVDAALCKCGIAGSDNQKRFFFHDLPDNTVNAMSVDFNTEGQIELVVQTLSAAGFLVRYQNPVAAQAPILSIDATGNVVTSAAFAVAANNTVTLLNCRDVNNRAIRGTFIAETVTDGTHFKLAHWGGSTVGRSGKVRLTSFLFGAALFLPEETVIRGGAKKVGRPFFQLRGRVPNRR